MVTFTLSQNVWEFSKSRTMSVSVVYVPTCQMRANFSFLCPNMPINVPMCQRSVTVLCQVSCHIKEKCAQFLFSETFLFFSYKWKHKKFWFLYVISNNGFPEFASTKTTKQNDEYEWILWSAWIGHSKIRPFYTRHIKLGK